MVRLTAACACIHAKRPDGSTIAVAYQYACHCTSISPELNKISADWAGLSAGLLEDAFRTNNSLDVVALPIIGCGADANPNPRGKYEHAQQHASEMAMAVQAVCAGSDRAASASYFASVPVSCHRSGTSLQRQAERVSQEPIVCRTELRKDHARHLEA